jgi:phosphoadenosine phosphosulfate reductase
MTATSVEEAARTLSGRPAEETLRWAVAEFGDQVALASSFGAEDVVLIDLLCRVAERPRIFAIDTGRLHEATYEVMDRLRARYQLRFEVYFPERSLVEQLATEHGFHSFRDSLEARHACCYARKVEPLSRALSRLDAWITGLRREQSVTRTSVAAVEVDHAHDGIVKINPLADWTALEVWEHIRRHDVPYNCLHDEGFPSIGCAPCTRAVQPGEHPRAGRWWWEAPEQKECGLHVPGAATGR